MYCVAIITDCIGLKWLILLFFIFTASFHQGIWKFQKSEIITYRNVGAQIRTTCNFHTIQRHRSVQIYEEYVQILSFFRRHK